MELKKKKPIAEIMLAPLIDIMMIFLLFFMIAYSRTSVQFYAQKVDIPKSSSAQKNEKKDTVIELAIDSEGIIFIDNQKFSPEDLKNYLIQKKQQGIEEVILRGDQKAPYQKIIFVIDKVKQSGISKVMLLTKKKTEE
ncbi:MAG TPA: hypothetical protein DHW82_11985 [Spirochaetia bacterium]|nr:MAG: hypothetical protein A2Y41_12520 [Spirochaetes bacterium GWB1_36_13]HCL57710.1 hypothetical protein [Spirochaetia bacterium]